MPHLVHAATAVNAGILFLAGLATVITSIVAVFALTQSVIGSDFIAKRVLLRNRSRTICRALNELGIPHSDLRTANQEISKKAVRSGTEPSVQEEIEWLSEISKQFSHNWTRPLELSGFTISDVPAEQLFALSEAYEQFSKSLRAQLILSSSAIMKEQQNSASNMARYLRLNANFRASKFRDPNAHRFQLQTEDMCVEVINPRINFSPSYQIDDIGVIRDPIRTVVRNFYDGKGLARDGVIPREIDIGAAEVKALSKLLSSDRAFDGVLPSLHGYHLQLDPSSGHLRLLLEISEISYSAILATHYFGPSGLGSTYDQLSQKAKEIDRLLTLCMMPLSSDGFLLAAQRSEHVGVARLKFAPGVNGNLELRDRLGLKVDKDEFELPDLISATVREANEELALVVDVSRVQILGLGRFTSEEEINVHVLLTIAPTELTFDQILEGSKRADLTEGAWELTGKFYRISVPKDPQDAEALIGWVIQSKRVAPHLVLALLAICLPFLTQGLKESLTETEVLNYWREEIAILLSQKRDGLPPGVVEIVR